MAELLVSTAQKSSLRVEFRNCDVNQIDFPDNAFDLVRVERVLMYLDEPIRALQEMARVIRPGGNIIAFDFDFGGYVFDSNYPALTRRIGHGVTEYHVVEAEPQSLIDSAESGNRHRPWSGPWQ